MYVHHQHVPADELTNAQRGECYGLYSRHYADVSWVDFNRELNGLPDQENSTVMLLVEPQHQFIVGFSTLIESRLRLSRKKVRIVRHVAHAVETRIRDHAHFDTHLAAYFRRLIASHPDEELYYVVISKEWRTYRHFSSMFVDYFPHLEKKTPKNIVAIVRAHGKRYYPAEYKQNTSVLQLNGKVGRLFHDDVDEKARLDPRAQFFAQANPGYLQGDALVCVARIACDNFTLAFARLTQYIY